MPQRYHPYDPADPKPATMYPADGGAYVTWEDYVELLKSSYAKGLEVWKAVVSTDVYQDLKHDKFRDIMTLLADGEISVGKAAQSIVERAGGIEPRLPEYDTSQWVDDKSWKERHDELKAEIYHLHQQLENGEAMYIAMRDRCARVEAELDQLKAAVDGN